MKAMISLAVACSVPLVAYAQSFSSAPRRVNVSDRIHGVAVPDPYRWMEDDGSAELGRWTATQNVAAEAFAGDAVQATYERLLSYSNMSVTTDYYPVAGYTYLLKNRAGTPRSGLYVKGPSGKLRHLSGLDLSDKAPPLDGVLHFWPSPDGKRVLVLRMPKDTRWGSLDLIESDTGRILKSHPNAFSTGTSASWLPDGSGYVFAAYDRKADASAGSKVVWIDSHGSERTVFDRTKDEKADRWILTPQLAFDSDLLFIQATDGTTGKNEVYLIDLPLGRTIRLFEADASWLLLGAKGKDAWFYTDKDAPNGRIVRVRDIAGQRRVETIIPEGPGHISANSQVGGNAYGMFGDRLAFLYLENAAPSIRIFNLDGRKTGELDVPATGTVWDNRQGFKGDPRKSELYYQFLGLSEPSSIYRVDLETTHRTLVKAPQSIVKPGDLVARRIFIDRGDGAKIPVLIAHRKGLALDRPHRTLLYGYGAFGWVSFLWYQPHVVDWLTQDDGIFVVAGVRGGGEFGSAWHDAGKGANRQTAIDDYAGVARYLIEQKLTRADMLVANGGSISGSLAAAAALQHPKLFGAVTLDFPALDLIRYPRFGSARLWTDELGSPDDPQQFKTLLSISPYHNVKDGTCYPPTLVRAGENDPTVTPVHAFKFTARLQHAQGCENPVLLDVMEGANHDFGSTPEQVAKSHAVMLEFLRRVLP